ncbi:sensor histidine kinase [Spirosoma areae]
MNGLKTYEELLAENERLRWQLEEATETIQAIRTGQIDALIVEGKEGHELYTLKTADQTFRVFIETMNEGAVTLSEDGLIVYCNSMFASMVERPSSQVIGLPFDHFITQDCQALYQTMFKSGWNEKRKVELALTSSTGHSVPCLFSVTTMALEEGTSLSVILTDLTAQKEAQKRMRSNNEQLKKSNNALEISNNALHLSNANLQQFAYIASHDLQEPLRKIQQFGSLLKMRYAATLGEEGTNWLERMEGAALRMSVLIRDLLAYSRLTVPIEAFVEQSLNKIAGDVLSLLDTLIQEKQATLEIGDLGTVPGEELQLAQVFQNLITNALKFARANVPPVIHISRQTVSRAELPRQYQPLNTHQFFCAIRVSDNGIGFDAHQAERIFGTFQRLHGRSQYPGTGIGLAIVKKVVENHQGYVIAQSQPDQGATFTVYLPI